jgi:hypothetical protein
VLGNPVEILTSKLRAIDFAEHHRMIPLGDLPFKVVSGGTVFGVDYPPVPRGDGIALHAPIAVRFDLPERVHRFAATASLDHDSLDWADMILIISDGRGELFKQRLNAQTPEVRINAEPRDRTLTVELDEGAQGPIRDRLGLQRAEVLIDLP